MQENNKILGEIGTAGGAEDVSNTTEMAVHRVVKANITVTDRLQALRDKYDNEEDVNDAASCILGTKRKKALLEKVKAGKTIDVEDIVSRWESTFLDIPEDFHRETKVCRT